MRRRLSAQQRQAVWQIRQRMAAEMEDSRTYTKNYGRLKVLEYLHSHPEDRGIRDIGVLFLDEVQDLNPVALRALRELTRGAMIMAGDGEQSIYSCRSPFRRSGINLRGATRILKTNFRNTIQVYDLADRFRRRSLADARPMRRQMRRCNADAPAEAAGPPFREGPPPSCTRPRRGSALLLEKIRGS
jgi:superfamily I DNA/RNA helicase